IGRPEIIAEDLGAVVPEATELREYFGFPGMRVLQNGFGYGARYDQPHNYVRNCVAFTGTHDNETLFGWLRSRKQHLPAPDRLNSRERVLRYVNVDRAKDSELVWRMAALLYQSAANTTIVPLQDVLGLGNEARMNTPATSAGNWRWRLTGRPLSGPHKRR